MDARTAIGVGLVSTLLCLGATPSAVAAPPSNDNFSTPTVLPGDGSGPVGDQTSIEATAEVGEPAHVGQGPLHSVWYSFAPDSAGIYRLRACPTASGGLPGGTSDLALALYTGSSLDALTSVGGDTDTENSTCTTPAIVEFCASVGTTYRIAVDDTSQLNFHLFINQQAPALSNDAFADADAISGSVVGATSRCATAEAGEPAHAGMGPLHSVWYSLAPDAAGLYRLRACPTANPGAGGDLALAVYTGGALGTLTSLGGATDTENSTCSTPATVELCASTGTTYRIAVEDTAGRLFNLLLSAPADIDEDGDCVASVDDTCPSVAGPSPAGCPDVARQLTLRYKRGIESFKGQLAPSGLCRTDETVTVLRKRKGPDRVVGSDETDASGKFRVPSRFRRGRYYATVEQSVEPTEGLCSSARSSTRNLG
jgi:hypothetical protein